MYLSFVEDKINKLDEEKDRLQNAIDEAESDLSILADELRQEMLDRCSEIIDRVLEEFDDDVFGEYEMEMQETFTEQVRMEI